MQNLSFILLVSLRLYFCQIISTCQLFSDNPLDCIEKTSDYSCNYNYFESKCIVEKKTSQGCLDTLNYNACINQLTNEHGEEAQCTFNKKCEIVLKSQLQTQGCITSYNKYACLNVLNADCQWKNSQCQPLEEILETANSCEESYQNSVTFVTCSKLQNLLCMSSGFKGEYGCVTVQEEQLTTLQCTQHGLTNKACVSIQTEGEECIFKDQTCQSMVQSEINSCLMDLNRQACLAIKNPYISCKWIDNSCYTYKQSNASNIDDLREVNISVCQSIKGLFRYDRENAKCIEIHDFKDISCNTLGLSKEGCLKVRNQNCIFYQGICQELNEQDLKTFSCNMELNELACINLETEFQYCKWNGSKCERLFMNQDFDCPLKFEDQSIKVNGNVCQAISKPNVLCKYDQKTNLCINSTPDDDCHTPYINQKGCVSVNNVKNKKTCKWVNYQCISVQIIAYFTTCESLQYANPQACSQVYENNSVGCYYDQIYQKCVTLQIKLQNDSQKEQQKLDLQFLNTISCENTGLGLNRVACGSITTDGVACMWKQDKCVFIDKKAMISAVPCLSLQWANARACNYAEFQKDICRYDVDQISCVTTTKDHMKCEEIGLNRYGCMIAEGFCYFNEELSLCLNDPSSNISEKLSCDKNSPSKPMCLSITKKGEYCIWQSSSGKCAKASIPFNSNCLTLGYQMNANTCTLIEMSFPDYNIDASKDKSLTLNYGYCKYNYNLNTCQIKNDNCKTKCCTDTEDIGINAHSCSRYSSQNPGVYCYFDEGRCKELTSDIANVLDPEAVKSYYNFKQFKCSQMNINSCSMIEWSTTQRCVHLGNSCFNINLKEQSSLKDLTEEPTITNKYTCFAIEAESLVDKYFTFDEVNRRCKILNPESETPFAKCEDAIGNRNLCLRFTGNNNCKWNSESLKCETIMNYTQSIQYYIQCFQSRFYLNGKQKTIQYLQQTIVAEVI